MCLTGVPLSPFPLCHMQGPREQCSYRDDPFISVGADFTDCPVRGVEKLRCTHARTSTCVDVLVVAVEIQPPFEGSEEVCCCCGSSGSGRSSSRSSSSSGSSGSSSGSGSSSSSSSGNK